MNEDEVIELDEEIIGRNKNDRPQHYNSPPFFEDENYFRNYSADILISGEFIPILYKEKVAYIYSGFLSTYPVMQITTDSSGDVTLEKMDDYLLRRYTLVNRDTFDMKKSYFDDVKRYFQFKENIMVATFNYERAFGISYCFTNMTMNEALLFIYIEFEMWQLDNIKQNERLNEFRGQKFEEDHINLWYSAPEGIIDIQTDGAFTIISYGGSC